MRSIGLDLGARHIAYCEVRDGEVIDRTSVKRLDQLKSRIGPDCPPARIAFDASREGWHVHDTLVSWGHDAKMIDTTRVRAMGVAHHRRKNDALDAEVAARAVDQGRIPEAHILSPARRAMRAQLSVRGALVETRSEYVTTIRGLGRAAGVLLPTCTTENFVSKVRESSLDDATRLLIAPLLAVLVGVEGGRWTHRGVNLRFGDRRGEALSQCAGGRSVPWLGAVGVDDRGTRKTATGLDHQAGQHVREKDARPSGLAHPPVARHGRPDSPVGNRIAKTRGKRIAAIAIARKLAGVLWAMWRDGTPYDPVGQAKASAKGTRREARSKDADAEALERAANKLQRRAPRRNKTSEDAVMT